MQHAFKCALLHLGFQNIGHIFIGISGMDNNGQAQITGGSNLGSKAVCLCLARSIIIKIIQPCLANSHAFRMTGQINQSVVITGLRVFFCLMGVNTDTKPDIVIAFGQLTRFMGGIQTHPDRDHLCHAKFGCAGDDIWQLFGKLRIIQMRMTIDNRQGLQGLAQCPSPFSSIKRGNTPSGLAMV